MSICPNCGAKVATAAKTWPVSFGKTKKSEGESGFFVGLFECPVCKTKFNSRVRLEEESAQTANVKNEVARIRGIREEFMQTLKALREKIQALETERAGLMGEIEKLRKAAESRAVALESEVSQMREEVKSLKELLGASEKQAQAPQPAPKPSSS